METSPMLLLPDCVRRALNVLLTTNLVVTPQPDVVDLATLSMNKSTEDKKTLEFWNFF